MSKITVVAFAVTLFPLIVLFIIFESYIISGWWWWRWTEWLLFAEIGYWLLSGVVAFVFILRGRRRIVAGIAIGSSIGLLLVLWSVFQMMLYSFT